MLRASRNCNSNKDAWICCSWRTTYFRARTGFNWDFRHLNLYPRVPELLHPLGVGAVVAHQGPAQGLAAAQRPPGASGCRPGYCPRHWLVWEP